MNFYLEEINARFKIKFFESIFIVAACKPFDKPRGQVLKEKLICDLL
jgi:hypothetical protein